MALLHLGSKCLPRSPNHLYHLLESLHSLVFLVEPGTGFKFGGNPGYISSKGFLARSGDKSMQPCAGPLVASPVGGSGRA